eukprot:18808-Heterococcus_DN1.PRE.4
MPWDIPNRSASVGSRLSSGNCVKNTSVKLARRVPPNRADAPVDRKRLKSDYREARFDRPPPMYADVPVARFLAIVSILKSPVKHGSRDDL